MDDYLLYYSWLTNGDNYKIFLSIRNQVPIDLIKLNEIKNELKNKGIEFITFMHQNYPPQLLYYKYPPYVLFYKGNLNLLKNEQIICVTGELVNNDDVNSFVYFDSNKEILANNITLVTNEFQNMDKNLTRYFRENKKPIIKVFANGFDHEMESNNFTNELWIGQYPPNTKPKRERFKERNLLTSALGKELILFSSKEKSKIMNLVNCFVEMGKDVSCFPGIKLEDGNNELIKSGAKMITRISDVVFVN